MKFESMIEPSATIIRNTDQFLFTQIDGEAVIMDTENGSYFGLNTVATDIWNLVEQPTTVSKIIEGLLDMYDVEPEICENDTFPIIEQMYKLKILLPAKDE